jgi:GT2 family glycosyltransferase
MQLHSVREVVIGPNDNFALALNAGIMASTGDFVALTDDDAEPSSDWIERLVEHFNDPSIAGVGGRDVQIQNPGNAEIVGIVKWYGKIIGNHHIGAGQARDVDVLKGVNCCFRGDSIRAIGVDQRLHGTGTVMHTELSLCLPLRRAGFRLVYDPTLMVLHHIAPRGDGDNNNRGGFNGPALRDIVHNETLVILEHLPWFRKVLYLSWGFLIGSLSAPGVLQIPRAIGKFGRVGEVIARWRYALAGRCAALVKLLRQPTEAPCHGLQPIGTSVVKKIL